MDEMAVREMNASLTTINGDLTVELQEAKDKLYKIQVGCVASECKEPGKWELVLGLRNTCCETSTHIYKKSFLGHPLFLGFPKLHFVF